MLHRRPRSLECFPDPHDRLARYTLNYDLQPACCCGSK